MIDLLWAKAFALTIALEVPIVTALAPRGSRRAAILVATATQAMTHPLAWLAFQSGWLGWWGIEIAVTAVEGTVYAIATRRLLASFCVSLLANAVSALLGPLLL